MMSLEFAVCSAVSSLRAQGLPSSALELADLSLQDDADQGRLWEIKGLLHAEQGETDLARRALETASSLVPLQPEGRCAMAECYALEGKNELARDLFSSLVEWNETPVELLLRIAAHFDHMTRSDLSVHACRKASLRDPSYARPYYDMAYYMRRCQYPVHLIESMARHAVRLDPDSVAYRVGLGVFLHSLDRVPEAYDIFSDLTLRQLQYVTCACCLNRILAAYEECGDDARAALCREQLRQEPSSRETARHQPVRIDSQSGPWANRFRLGIDRSPE